MTRIMAPYLAKQAGFFFGFLNQCLHIAIDTKGLLHIFY